jgi:hypothetical protein
VEARAKAIRQFLVKERGVAFSRIDVVEPTQTESRDSREVVAKLSLDVSK